MLMELEYETGSIVGAFGFASHRRCAISANTIEWLVATFGRLRGAGR
jgi:hypothetical protein